MAVLGSDDLDKTYPHIVASYDEEPKLVGSNCGCGAHNLNDDLQCMLCGTWNDELVTEKEYYES